MATLQIPDLLTEFELFLTNLNLQKHLQKFHPTVKSFFNCHKLCFLETLDIMLEFLNKNKKACAKKFEGSHSYEENSKSMYNLWKELKREAKMNILQENFFEGFLKSKENIYNELSFKDEAYFYNFMDILKKLDEIFYLSWNRIKYKIFSSNNKLLKIGDI